MNKPQCKLIGVDGNIFVLASKVTATLKKADQVDKAKEFTDRLYKCGSYNKALMLITEYVEVV